MTIGLHHPTDPDAFLRWVERQDSRYEMVDGRLVMMVNVSKDHAIIASNLLIEIAMRIDRSRYHVFAAEFAVKTGRGVRFPDVIVEGGAGRGKIRAAEEPLFIAEILSPSSLQEDFYRKPHEYRGLASLRAYALFSQDEPHAWLWRRTPEGWPDLAEELEGFEARLAFDLPDRIVDVPLAAIYPGFAAAS